MKSTRRWVLWAVMVVAASVGGNVVLAAIADVLWIKDSGVARPDEVVAVFASSSPVGDSRESAVSFTERAIRRRMAPTEAFAGLTGQVLTDGENSGLVSSLRLLGGSSKPRVAAVTSTYFTVLGVSVRGRNFTSADDLLTSEPTIILSLRYWRRVFSSDPSVIGRVIDAMPGAVRVIGVVDGPFTGALRGERIDAWIPQNVSMRFSRTPLEHLPADSLPLMVMGRLAPGLTLQQAEEAVGTLGARSLYGPRARLVPLRNMFGPLGARAFQLDHASLGIAIGVTSIVVALSGVVSLAGMAFAGFERRRSDWAIRFAVGASPAHLAHTLLTDLGALVMGGSVAGAAVASLAIHLITRLDLPPHFSAELSLLSFPVVLWGAAVGMITVAAACIYPVLRLLGTDPLGQLQGRRPNAHSSRGRSGLLAGTIAGTTVLTVIAAVFMGTARDSFSDARGFPAGEVLYAEIRTRTAIGEDDALWQRHTQHQLVEADRLTARLAGLLGVEATAMGKSHTSQDYSRQQSSIRQIGTSAGELPVRYIVAPVGAGYVRAMGIALIKGRDFAPEEFDAAIISRSLANLLSGPDEIVGKSIRLGSPVQVIGVFEDVAFGGVGDGPTPAALIQRPVAALTEGTSLAWVVRTKRPDAIRGQIVELIEEHFPEAADYSVISADEATGLNVAETRIGAGLFTAYAVVSLVVAGSGIWGLVTFLVDSQRRDIGIRMALGATARHVRILVLAGVLGPGVVGLSLGLAGAATVHRVLSAWLPTPLSSSTASYLAGGLMVVCVSAISAWLASRRVDDVPPVEVIRS